MIYPYPPRGVAIERAHQVWRADVHDVPMASGTMYLATAINWHSRQVIACPRWNALDGSF